MPEKPASPILQRVSPRSGMDDVIIDYKNLRVRERKDLTLIQVLAFANQYQQAAGAISNTLGIECPTLPGRYSSNEQALIVWHGPNNWMIIADDETTTDHPAELVRILQIALGDIAAIVDQSHARYALRLSGALAPQVMAKHTPIDLHPAVFVPGQCALAPVAHIPALVIQADDAPTYDLFVARSLALSFTHAIEHACREFADD